MDIKNNLYKELNSKTKIQLNEELITLKNINGKIQSTTNSNNNLSNELGKLILENSQDGILILNEQSEIEYANKKFIDLTGYNNEEILGRNYSFLFKNPNNENLLELNNIQNYIYYDTSFELTISRNSQTDKIFEVRNTLVQDSFGNKKTLSQFKDITERKNAEEVIKESEIKFRTIVENSHLGILIVGNDFKFEYVNDQLCKILRTTKDNLINKDFRAFLSDDSKELVVKRYKMRQAGENVPSEYKIKVLTAEGTERIVKLSSNVVSYSGQPKTIAQLLDITEKENKHKLEKVLLNISQAVNEVKNLNEFLGIVRQELSSVLDTTNFYVALYEESSDTYTFPYHIDEYDSIDEITQLELKDSLTDYVRRKSKAVLVNQEMQSILENEGEIKGVIGESSPIWIGAPLVVDNHAVGTICLQNYHNEQAYNKSDLEILKIVSENVSSAIWRKQIVDKLAESELRYRDFISRSSEGIYRIDFDPPIKTDVPHDEQVHKIILNGIIGECNNSFAEMYNFESNKDIIGRNLNVFYGNRISKENFNANLQFVQNNYRITDVETFEFNSKGERLVILNNSIGIIKNECLVNIWGIQKDITESKKYQNILQRIAEGISSSIGDSFFKSIVQFLCETLKVDYAFIAQLSDNSDYANSLAFWGNGKLLENFNYSLENSPTKLVLKNGKTTIIKNVQQKFSNDKFSKKYKIKDYLARPLLNSEDKPIGILVILNRSDIASIEFTKSVLEIFATRCSAEIERILYVKELLAAKNDAERSNNLKSDFLAQMSHEIRTPVNTILSFTPLLKESLEDKLEEDLKDSFKIIENGGNRLIRTIDLILNVSQLQSGNLKLSPIKLNLIEVLKDLISEFKHAAKKENLDLDFSSRHSVLNIFADTYTITQIFANLIHNSIKYTTNGSIKIIAEQNINKEVVVKVVDTGVGMSDDFLKHLFDPFSQEETGYTRKFEGTGLGLTLVRKYCELNGATITVKSKKNQGSTFIVKFSK